MKRSIKAGERVRRVLGVLVLAGVAAIALGLDTGLLTRVSLAGTASVEQALLDRFHPTGEMESAALPADGSLPVEGAFPSLAGATEWLNSPPLTPEQLRGKVVLVDFWTYSCINCLRALPYVRAWAEKYRDQGLVVIGVHAPEFAFEKDPANVRRAVKDIGIAYPVALDNDRTIWRAFANRYWPAHYFIDGKGRIRHHHFGEGGYAESEKVIQRLLAENGSAIGDMNVVTVDGQGVGAAASGSDVQSPETYVGYARAVNFVQPGGIVRDEPRDYAAPVLTKVNQWGLSGAWTVAAEQATSNAAGAGIAFRFHARDVHLVLGPAAAGKPVRFRITIDGKPPGQDRGMDVGKDGLGRVTGQRLYQLVRQQNWIVDHSFQIEFLDPGVQAFAFTFG
jgi:thiol-disulfide isomerase/thioredoxin